jgi:hypothetical protein
LAREALWKTVIGVSTVTQSPALAGRPVVIPALGKDGLDLGRIERGRLNFSNQIRLPDDLTLLSVYRPVDA